MKRDMNMTTRASLRAGLRCLFCLIGDSALGQTSSLPGTSEPGIGTSEARVALPPLPWTLPPGQIEIRGALGLTHAGDRHILLPNLAASIPLTDWFQVTVTHQLQPSATARVGEREGRLQASFSAGITSLDLLEGKVSWFGNASLGFEAWSATWLIVSMGREVEYRPLSGERSFTDYRLGMVLTPHPRLRFQPGLVTRPTTGINDRTLIVVGLGSALHPGGRGWPLIQWQLLPSLSLDGYGSMFLYEGKPSGLQGQVGFTWTPP